MQLSRRGLLGSAAALSTVPLVRARGQAKPTIKLGVLTDGGLPFAKRTPEADEINFAPRVKIPVLMVNGRYDFIFPLETSQAPLFRLLGTLPKDKRHVVLDSAHDILSRPETVREILDWLDRYFGPVK